ncbi:MAG: ribosome-binding factor A [Parcubacteria group bacterium]|jgi:ribosome-binding factor A|nr:ribosome-binding factor A [Parcubacteria group bacterium]
MKTPIKHKDKKASSLILKFASEYFLTASNNKSLITITKAEVLNKGKRAIIYFTAFPIEKEAEALKFMNRRRNDFRQFVMSKKSFGFVPKIEFCIDIGEHNRQRIDELSNEYHKTQN